MERIENELLSLFDEAYDKLYNNPRMDLSDANRKRVEAFYERMERDSAFQALVYLFSIVRKDFISSDREAKAFMIAVEKFGQK